MDDDNLKKDEISERQVVVFKIGNEEYGVNIHNVKEIIRYITVTKVPETSDHIEGVINLRGEVTAIINLRKIFNMEITEMNEKTRVLIMDMGTRRIGIIVDRVSEVLRLDSDKVLEAKNLGSGEGSKNVQGMGKVGDRLIILLDLKSVIKDLDLGDMEALEPEKEIEAEA
ncbi:MAG: chemotaxis protein CheW [Candidatus Thermoplasmatota archaeon]|nr:chemotaxis protein CheW [Candidatus Thermoplasmatota archaeon]